MNKPVLISKNEDEEQAVPTEWRETFVRIMDSFVSEDYLLERPISGVEQISPEEAERMAGNVKAYGHHLVALPEQTWETSVYLWMGHYWQVLIDLFTLEEGASDLALFVHVYEDGESYKFKIDSLHVP